MHPEIEPIMARVELPSALSDWERQTVAAVKGAKRNVHLAYSMEWSLALSVAPSSVPSGEAQKKQMSEKTAIKPIAVNKVVEAARDASSSFFAPIMREI